MMMIEELFLIAVNTYKDWWACGRDFNLHADKFEAWDKAILDFASAANVDRNYAIVQVRTVLGMAN
jgi:hypothetical protein